MDAERGNPAGVWSRDRERTRQASRPTAREEQASSRTRCPKKRMLPAERQREPITGQIGPRERRDPPRKGADVGQGTNRPEAMNTGQRWRKLDTADQAVNRPTGSIRSTLPVDRTGAIGLGAAYSVTGKRGSEAGRVPRGTDLCHCALAAFVAPDVYAGTKRTGRGSRPTITTRACRDIALMAPAVNGGGRRRLCGWPC